MKRIILVLLICALALAIVSCAVSASGGTDPGTSTAPEDKSGTEGESKLDTVRVYELANGNPLIFYESDIKALRSELTLYEDGTYTLTRTELYPGYSFEYRGETVNVDYKTVCYTSGGTYVFRTYADGTVHDNMMWIVEESMNVKISVPVNVRDAIVESACERSLREEDRDMIRAEYSEKGYDYQYSFSSDHEAESAYHDAVRLDDAAGRAYYVFWWGDETTAHTYYDEQGICTRRVSTEHLTGEVTVTEYLYDESGALTGYIETKTDEKFRSGGKTHVRVETNEFTVINGKLVQTGRKVTLDGELIEEDGFSGE